LNGYEGLGKAAGFGDFDLGPGVSFEFQHHARWQSESEITLFNDASLGNIAISESESRAMVLKLAFGSDTSSIKSKGKTTGNSPSAFSATLVREFINPTHPLSQAQGSLQPLSNGNYWVGYGAIPLFAEYSPSGTLISQYQIAPTGSDVKAYRSIKANFTLSPRTKPDLAVQNGTAYMSWNGATEVKTWAIYSAPEDRAEEYKLVGKIKKGGFETKFVFPDGYDLKSNFTVVDALDGKGKLLGWSKGVKENA